MGFKENITKFVNKQGLSYRSYVVAALIFPPAAVYIAFKRPGVPMVARVALSAIALVAPPFSLFLVGFLTQRAVQLLG